METVRKNYETPEMEVVEVEVERGFFVSGDTVTGGDFGDGGED